MKIVIIKEKTPYIFSYLLPFAFIIDNQIHYYAYSKARGLEKYLSNNIKNHPLFRIVKQNE